MTPVRASLAAAFLLVAPSPAAAQPTDFNLPAGRLGQSVALLGQQARVTIGLTDPQLQGRRVKALRGRMTVDQALEVLLRGTDARILRIDDVTFRIVRGLPPLPPRRPVREPVKVAPVPVGPAPIVTAEDIVVVGSRRRSLLSDYPGGVTIVSGSDLDLSGVALGSEALAHRLANVTTTHLGPGRNKIFIRGMSESNVNGTTQATVGQYFGDFRLNYNAPDPDLRLYDISRIEVLEGPQGTLYGAGALGGIVRVMPNNPDPSITDIKIEAGLTATAHGEAGADTAGTINLPLSDRVAGRLTAYAIRDGGYIDDIGMEKKDVNRVHTTGGRLAFRFEPTENWTIDTVAVAQRIRGDDAQYAERDLAPLTRRSAVSQFFKNDYRLLGLSANRVSEWRDFTLSFNHVRQRLFERFDATAAVNPTVAYDLSTQADLVSGEARVVGRQENGASWVLGTAFFSNKSDQERDVDFFVRKEQRNRITNKVLDLAVFGEGQFPLSRKVDLTIGARLAHARLESEGFLFRPGFGLPPDRTKVERSALRFLPTIALAGRPRDDLLLFARYQEGFRPGGLSVGTGGIKRFDADRIRSIEAGLRKGQQGRGRYDVALSVGYVDWNNVQGDTLDLFAEPSTVNIGDARNLFIDASGAWRPLSGLKLDAGIVVVDSKITKGVTKGLALPGVAPLSLRAGISYSFQAFSQRWAMVGLSSRYTGKSKLDTGVSLPGFEDFLQIEQGGWIDTALLGQLDLGRALVTLNVTNLTDVEGNRFALGTPLLLGEREFTTPLRPRAIRLGIEVPLGN